MGLPARVTTTLEPARASSCTLPPDAPVSRQACGTRSPRDHPRPRRREPFLACAVSYCHQIVARGRRRAHRGARMAGVFVRGRSTPPRAEQRVGARTFPLGRRHLRAAPRTQRPRAGTTIPSRRSPRRGPAARTSHCTHGSYPCRASARSDWQPGSSRRPRSARGDRCRRRRQSCVADHRATGRRRCRQRSAASRSSPSIRWRRNRSAGPSDACFSRSSARYARRAARSIALTLRNAL